MQSAKTRMGVDCGSDHEFLIPTPYCLLPGRLQAHPACSAQSSPHCSGKGHFYFPQPGVFTSTSSQLLPVITS